MNSYKVKKNNADALHEVWACGNQGETLVGSFRSFLEAAQFMRQLLPGTEEGGLPPMPKLSYTEQLRQENQRLKAEIARLKALLGEK